MMSDTLAQNWDNRYKKEIYAYGTKPNQFFKEQIDALPPGKILFAAAGEGRNAVYAATQGWDVYAFDISIEAKKKAEKLAEEKQVSIDYRVGNLADLGYKDNFFDVIVFIFAHFAADLRTSMHSLLSSKLKKEGLVIMEAFSKNHLEYREKNPKVGGPPNPEVLISKEDIKADFAHYKIITLEEKVVELKEGIYHNGTSSVIRFIGQKK